MEAKGACELPDGMDYLSVHSDISPLVLGLPSEAQKVPVRRFLQTAKTKWNSMWECWLPDFAWSPVRGLCGNEEFERALAEIQHEESVRSSKASSGATTGAAARRGVFFVRRSSESAAPAARGGVHPGLDRWEISLCRASKPGVCSRRAPDSPSSRRCSLLVSSRLAAPGTTV